MGLPKKICKFCKEEFTKSSKYSNNQVYCCRKCCKKGYYYGKSGKNYYQISKERNNLKYKNDPEYRKRILNNNHKYVTSEKGRQTKSINRIKYRNTENGKISDLKYNKSEKRKISSNKYTKTPKGKINSIKGFLARIERLNSVIHKFSQEEWKIKVEKTKGVCLKCNLYVGIDKLTLDHIYPISKAYNDYLKTKIKRIYEIKDVQPLCKSCNCSKNNRI